MLCEKIKTQVISDTMKEIKENEKKFCCLLISRIAKKRKKSEELENETNIENFYGERKCELID